jgi:hypothetical protein
VAARRQKDVDAETHGTHLETQAREELNKDKVAYLRAQLRVFRRTY